MRTFAAHIVAAVSIVRSRVVQSRVARVTIAAAVPVTIAVAICAGFAGCGDNRPVAPDAPVDLEVASFPATPNPQLDLLFLIDDSPGATEYEGNLKNNLPALLGVFGALEVYPLDVHVGVATSDLGTTGSLDPGNPAPAIGSGPGACAGFGKDGRLRTDPTVQDAFIADTVEAGGTHQGNFTGSLRDALVALLSAGGGGCGFEQHLAAIHRALTNPVNAGFVRPDANLAVILVGDEDDCSVHDAAGLFALGTTAIGALQSFRCTSQGLICDQPIDTIGPKTNCRPRGSQYIDDVAPFVRFLLDFKGDSRKLMFGLNVGNPSPVAVEARAPPGGGTPIPGLAHSCSYEGSSGNIVADPGVRDVAAALAFPPSTSTAITSICTSDQSPQLTQMAKAIKRLIGDSCIDTTSLDPTPSCTVEDLRDSEPGHAIAISPCPSTGDCFELVPDARVCPYSQDHLRAVIHRVAPAATDTWTHVRCHLASL